MIYTEEEAKERWCPMVRFHMGFQGFVYDNKPGNSQAHNYSCFCLASDCMMWAWADGEPRMKCMIPQNLDSEEEPERPSEVPASWKWISASEASDGVPHWHEPQSEANARRQGFCGLGGKP